MHDVVIVIGSTSQWKPTKRLWTLPMYLLEPYGDDFYKSQIDLEQHADELEGKGLDCHFATKIIFD